MWSIGCIFGELLCRKLMFPVTSTSGQINKVFDATGKLIKEIIALINSELVDIMLEKFIVNKNNVKSFITQDNRRQMESTF